MERVTNLQAAFAGVAGAAAGFAITYPLRAVSRAPFLPEISAQLAVEYAPGGFSRLVIERFGTEDEVVGTAVAFVVYFLVAMLFGLLFSALRNRLPGRTGLAEGLTFTPIPLSYVQAAGAPSGNLLPFITSNTNFYQISKDLVSPHVNETDWRLSIGGNVEHLFQVTYQELLSLPTVEQVMTLECI